jgi:hypothetical protein
MRNQASGTLRAFLVELPVYAVLVVAYFFAVLHFLQGHLLALEKQNIKLYALAAIGLIVGQAVLLETVTTFLLRMLRGRSE